MKKRGEGKIINMVDVSADRPWVGFLPYCTSKAGLGSLTIGLARALAPEVQVNAIAPGYIETDFNREFFASDAGKAMIRRIPQRRLGLVSDLDGVLLLLAGDGSALMTGSIITIDGGHSLAIA